MNILTDWIRKIVQQEQRETLKKIATRLEALESLDEVERQAIHDVAQLGKDTAVQVQGLHRRLVALEIDVEWLKHHARNHNHKHE